MTNPSGRISNEPEERRERERERERENMPFIVATYVYASSQGQRTHSARTNILFSDKARHVSTGNLSMVSIINYIHWEVTKPSSDSTIPCSHKMGSGRIVLLLQSEPEQGRHTCGRRIDLASIIQGA